jgi:hypothetical protein
MSHLRRIAASVAAVSAAAALVLAPPASAAATTRATTTNPAKAAGGWLAQQLVAGTHLVFSGTTFVDYGGTADLGFALAAGGVGRSTVDNATTYLARHLSDYVDYSGANGGPYDGSIGKAAVAALVDGRDPNRFGGHHLLRELKNNETSDGDNRNIFSTVSTSFIVIAEARGARHDGRRFAPSHALVKFFLAQQCGNGGFSSDIRTAAAVPCTADVDATGYALMALQALGGHADVIKHAASWLAAKRAANGSWTAQGGPDIDSTALATVGLHIAGRSTTKSLAWLKRQQVTTGPTVGAGAERGALKYFGKFDPASSIKGTSDGVLGLTLQSLATLSVKGASKSLPVLALDKATLSHPTVKRGSAEKVTGTGFAAKERVFVTVGSEQVGRHMANKDGTLVFRFTMPGGLSSGQHTVKLTGHRSDLTSKVSVTVK